MRNPELQLMSIAEENFKSHLISFGWEGEAEVQAPVPGFPPQGIHHPFQADHKLPQQPLDHANPATSERYHSDQEDRTDNCGFLASSAHYFKLMKLLLMRFEICPSRNSRIND